METVATPERKIKPRIKRSAEEYMDAILQFERLKGFVHCKAVVDGIAIGTFLRRMYQHYRSSGGVVPKHITSLETLRRSMTWNKFEADYLAKGGYVQTTRPSKYTVDYVVDNIEIIKQSEVENVCLAHVVDGKGQSMKTFLEWVRTCYIENSSSMVYEPSILAALRSTQWFTRWETSYIKKTGRNRPK